MVRSRIQQLVDEATDPGNTSSNDKQSRELCVELNKYRNGEVIVLRCLVEKVRTFEEKIAIQALNVIEFLVENLGDHFREEIGRNRFLNEFAKLLSPRYDSEKCPKAIKDRVSIIFQHWYRTYPQYSKIIVAYKTLRSKGYLTAEQTVEAKKIIDEEVIGDVDSNKILNELLKSKAPADLERANTLIRSMVRKEENRSINIYQRREVIDDIQKKISQFRKLLATYRETHSMDYDAISILRKELFDYHKNLNLEANKAVSERDPHVGELFALSDDLTSALNEYISFEALSQARALNEFTGVDISAPQSNRDDEDLLDLGSSFNPVATQSHPEAPTKIVNEHDSLLDIFSAPSNYEAPQQDSTNIFNMVSTENAVPQQQTFANFCPIDSFNIFGSVQPNQPTNMSGYIQTPIASFTQPVMHQNVYGTPVSCTQPQMSSAGYMPNSGMMNNENFTASSCISPDTSQFATTGAIFCGHQPTSSDHVNIPSAGASTRSCGNLSNVSMFGDLLSYSGVPMSETSKQTNMFENFTVDLSDLDVLNPRPVTGCALGVFVASAKEKSFMAPSGYIPSSTHPDIYILSLMNMLPNLVESIQVATESQMMNVKIIPNERTYLTAFSPMTSVSTTSATILCDKSIKELSISIAYTIDSVRKKDVILLSLK